MNLDKNNTDILPTQTRPVFRTPESLEGIRSSKYDGMGSILSEVTSLRQENRMIYHDVKHDLEQIKQAVVKKPKEKKATKPLRDPINRDMFLQMLSLSKEKGEKQISYSRFRVAIVLLWYTGLRVNEIRMFTRKDIETLRDESVLQVFQPKVNKYKKVYFPDEGQTILTWLENDIDIIFSKHPYLSGGSSNLSWIRFMNIRLRKKSTGFSSFVRSHSFRVNYATSLLKHAPVQDVAELMGHSEIKTTLKYNRYRATAAENVDLVTKVM
ncbi:hypothetical protein Ndes2437B_g09175 [Nannochloris sp. 'desiccata']|nr:hypothetical protein KSW81_004546 [Chlorella desiccata (nom. nud.)]KAG7666494.1 hypothetical protein KSW81_004557 [Chlorella desiccata (nom. nud.)]UIO59460.1 Tyrosine recombinase XerC [Chlorella desiccata (nom. nud.)]